MFKGSFPVDTRTLLLDTSSASVLPTKHLPKGLAVGSSGVSVIGTVESLLLIKDKKEVFNTSVQSPPGAVAIKADDTEVAVGSEVIDML